MNGSPSRLGNGTTRKNAHFFGRILHLIFSGMGKVQLRAMYVGEHPDEIIPRPPFRLGARLSFEGNTRDIQQYYQASTFTMLLLVVVFFTFVALFLLHD